MENRCDTHFKYSQNAAKRQYILKKKLKIKISLNNSRQMVKTIRTNVLASSTLNENKNCDVEQKGRIKVKCNDLSV